MSPIVPASPGRRVLTQALPGVRADTNAPAAAFGVPATVDLSGPQRLFAQIQAEEAEKADQIAVLDADTKLGDAYQDLLHNPQKGVLNRTGQNAFGAPEEVTTEWRKRVNDIRSGLHGDRQQMAFERMVASRAADLDRTVQVHVNREVEKFDAERTQAALDNELNIALENYGNPARVQQSIDYQRAALTDFGRRTGAPAERIADMTARRVSHTRTGVLNRLLNTGQDLAAKAYFDAHRGELVGEELLDAERAVSVGSTLGEAQRQSKAIAERHTSLTKALEEVDAIRDPKIQEATRDRVKERFAERKAQEREDYEALTEQAFGALVRTGNVPAPLLAKLKPQELASVNSYRRQLAARQEPDTDWGIYYKLKNAAADPETRTEFLETNLLGYRSKLGDTEFKELVNAQAGLRKGEPVPGIKSYRTTKQIVDGTLKSLGIPLTGKVSKRYSRQAEGFRRAVDEQITALQESTGKPVQPAQVQQIVDDIVIKRWRDETLWEHLQEKDVSDIDTIDEVPLVEQRKIRAALFRDGINPSPDEIVAVYRLRLARLRQESFDADEFLGPVSSAPQAQTRTDEIELAEMPDEVRDEIEAALRKQRLPVSDSTVLTYARDMQRALLANESRSTPDFAERATRALPLTSFAIGAASLGIDAVRRRVGAGDQQETPKRAATSPTAPVSSKKPDPDRVYTASPKDVIDVIVAYRDHDQTNFRIPGEEEDLDAREAFLTEFLRNRYSLGKDPDKKQIVRNARLRLTRIERIRRGEIKPNALYDKLHGGR